ncbi:MAG: leucine-rich repeat domain-containing protein [Thermoanaerobaculaceae bacterium]
MGFLITGVLVLAPGLATAAIPAAERQALIALYTSTAGSGWLDRSNWRNPGDTDFNAVGTECTWYGVFCDVGETHVTDLALSSNQLSGTLPAELGNLPSLLSLDLWGNSLTGSLPPQLGNLANLQGLDLYSNLLSGSIPPELGNLTNLQYLYLDSNQFSGSIPSQLGSLTSLEYLWLSGNLLSGSIPSQLGNLTNLLILYLDGNQLSGSIPGSLGSLASIQDLNLADNLLTGSIPPAVGSLTSLQSLSLWGNQLTGSIPGELGALANLQYLYLDGNQLSGSIPPSLGLLTSLLYLDLRENQLTGAIPPELGNLTNLLSLSLFANRLSGPLPASLGSLVNLQSLYLGSNQLSGAIPPEFVGLTSLMPSADWGLDLRWNALHTTNAALRAFLDTKQYGGNWEGTQTIPPTNVAAGTPGLTTMATSWTPIAYTADTGGYRVWARPGASGAYQVVGMTADKTLSGLVVSGLNPATAYSFQLQTLTNPHVNNLNIVTSEFSLAVEARTAGFLSPTTSDVDKVGGTGLISNLNGVLEPGETVAIASAWKNTDTVAHVVNGTATSLVGPAGATYTIADPTAAFGTVAAGATANCDTATGNCYAIGMSNPPARPAPHWDVDLTETLSTGEVKTWTVHVGRSFADVPEGYWAYPEVEALFHAGLTTGCGQAPLQYCPENLLTRAEMAAFLVRGLHGAAFVPPAATGTVFADVPVSHWAAAYIEQLFADGLTTGCIQTPQRLYCPENLLTRSEMAIFLLRLKHGAAYAPPPGTGAVFTDVPLSYWAVSWIEQLFAEGITTGCGIVGMYCPDEPLPRSQMAVFLKRTLGLQMAD